MIRRETAGTPLPPALEFGLDVLIDQSRLLPVTDAAADVVRVVVSDGFAPSFADWSAGAWGYDVADGVVRVPRTALAHVTAVAGAGAEQVQAARDRFGRVPSAVHPLVLAGREREPVVSQAAVALREAVRRAAAGRPLRVLAPWPGGRRWAAAFTHDVDVVAGWPAFTALRLVELGRKREAGRAARVVAAALGAVGRDPAWRGTADVIECERKAGATATWFVLTGTPTWATIRAGDLTYRPESAAACRISAAIGAAGSEVGLHGSFATLDGGTPIFAEQRGRLAGLSGQPTTGVRQHYLRMVPGVTARAMAGAGFAYDATLGFADRNGFRLGSADTVPAWDAGSATTLGIDEVPLLWMDRALSKYQGVEDPDRWVDDALALADACQAVDGLWVGLWHCNLTPALGYPGAPAAYARLVETIAARGPWIATLAEIVAWRAARRSIRATAVTPDGAVTLDGVAPGASVLFDD